VAGERLLVNFFYAAPVRHVIEALHHCLGHHLADPSRRVAVVLNASTALELAAFFCPFVPRLYAVPRGRHAVAGAVGRALVRVLLQPRPGPLDHSRRRPLPTFTQFGEPEIVEDEDGPRTRMSRARIEADLARIVGGADELIRGALE
jgi:hypothetical protein